MTVWPQAMVVDDGWNYHLNYDELSTLFGQPAALKSIALNASKFKLIVFKNGKLWQVFPH